MSTLQDRPNILWICTDQQRYDTIHSLGNPHITTPNIDRLISEGVAFTHAYCQCPVCTPSRASFLTGMYPSSVHGCMNGNESWGEAAPLVTKQLADSGYDCGLSGKLHLAGAQDRIEPRPTDDGYRVFNWSHDPRDIWPEGHDYKEWVEANGKVLKDFNEHPEDVPPEMHHTEWCADKAIEFFSEEREGPWLFSVNQFDPHPPFNPPGEYLKRYDPNQLPGPLFRESDIAAQEKLMSVDGFNGAARSPEELNGREIQAAYYAMVELVDHSVGRMLEALEQTGQRENTLVIFTSDHGELLGDHGFASTKGCRFYEGSVRVPLVISLPGQVETGLVSNALVELTDIAPTLLELANVPVSPRIKGRSLLPLLTGTSDTNHHRDFVRCEYYRDQTLNPEIRPHFEGSYATMIRDRQYKLVVYHGRETGQLYDLEKDPDEFDNLWDHPDYVNLRFDLMKLNFDALAFAVDVGSVPTQGF